MTSGEYMCLLPTGCNGDVQEQNSQARNSTASYPTGDDGQHQNPSQGLFVQIHKPASYTDHYPLGLGLYLVFLPLAPAQLTPAHIHYICVDWPWNFGLAEAAYHLHHGLAGLGSL